MYKPLYMPSYTTVGFKSHHLIIDITANAFTNRAFRHRDVFASLKHHQLSNGCILSFFCLLMTLSRLHCSITLRAVGIAWQSQCTELRTIFSITFFSRNAYCQIKFSALHLMRNCAVAIVTAVRASTCIECATGMSMAAVGHHTIIIADVTDTGFLLPALSVHILRHNSNRDSHNVQS